MDTKKSLLKQFNYDTLISKAHLIMMNPQGEVILVKNEDGGYCLPSSELFAKMTLENSLRKTMNETWNVEVGTVTLLGADSGYTDNHFELNTIYYTEDFFTEETFEVFDVESLPMTTNAQTKEIIDAYVDGVKVQFMNYLALHGDIY